MLTAALGCRAEPATEVPQAQSLGRAVAEFPEPFTGPIRMVELRDGHVLLMDTRESRLLRLDFASGQVDSISRSGDGPLEYRGSIFRLALAPGDSVWGYDLRRRRILVFAPDGEPVRGFSTMTTTGRAAEMSAPWMTAVDSVGAWLGYGLRFAEEPPFILPDLVVVRVDTRTGLRDTVTRLASPRSGRTPLGQSIVGDFDPRDAWAAFSDGRVLVVRGAEYLVELHQRDGGVDTVGRVPYRPVPLTLADAERLRDSSAKLLGALVSAAMANMPELRNRPLPPTHVLPDPLPEHWPVLAEPEIPVDRRDRAWVRVRTTAFDTGSTRYDLIDRDGRFVKAVAVPAGELVVGFGRDVVYTARRDEDELQWLRRYPLP
jgi:hypothetical protein